MVQLRVKHHTPTVQHPGCFIYVVWALRHTCVPWCSIQPTLHSATLLPELILTFLWPFQHVLLQVALVEQLVADTWTGPAAVLLNASFLSPGTSVPAAQQPFVSNFGTAYCFQPVEIKGLLGSINGAVVKVSGPGADGPLWRICMSKQGVSSDGNMVQVGRCSSICACWCMWPEGHSRQLTPGGANTAEQ